MTFASLGLSAPLCTVVEQIGYVAPTDIQTLAIPAVLAGTDLLIQAKTGSGKTAAFALPIIERMSALPPGRREVLSTLVLAPTRELAVQVAEAFATYARSAPRPISVVALVGGTSIERQMEQLFDGVSVAVATPGRLLDLADRSEISFDAITTLVLDEADKMLDLGFAEAMELLLLRMPPERQTILLSATFPKHIGELTAKFLLSPRHIAINEEVPTVEAISQRAIEVNHENRGPLLRFLLKDEAWRSVLIFVGSQKAAVNITAKLRRDGVAAEAFHGDLMQCDRTTVLDAFKYHRIKVLVATDLAARGIDFSRLSHVVNYDLPRSPADYIHRIGRTGRAGESGVAVSFVGHEDQAHFRLIEKRAKIKLAREQIAGFELTGNPVVPQRGEAIKGKGHNKKEKSREAMRKRGFIDA